MEKKEQQKLKATVFPSGPDFSLLVRVPDGRCRGSRHPRGHEAALLHVRPGTRSQSRPAVHQSVIACLVLRYPSPIFRVFGEKGYYLFLFHKVGLLLQYQSGYHYIVSMPVSNPRYKEKLVLRNPHQHITAVCRYWRVRWLIERLYLLSSFVLI